MVGVDFDYDEENDSLYCIECSVQDLLKEQVLQ
jgi:hypothetical protein